MENLSNTNVACNFKEDQGLPGSIASPSSMQVGCPLKQQLQNSSEKEAQSENMEQIKSSALKV